MNKNYLLLVIILVLVVSNVSAISWEEQRVIAREVGRKFDVSSSLFGFNYYTSGSYNGSGVYATYVYRNGGRFQSITFYKQSLNLTSFQVKCVTLHEIGHYFDARSSHYNGSVLTEEKADEFMLSKNSSCSWWRRDL